MKKNLTLFFVIFIYFLNISWSQSPLDYSTEKEEKYENVFKEGEWLQFIVSYEIFNASYITLELKLDTINKIPVFHAKGYGTTTGLARLFFKVEDYYDTYFSQEKGLPLKFKRNIYEGGYTKDLEILFDHENEIAKIKDKKNKKNIEAKLHPVAQDLLSSFYYLRNVKNTSLMKSGESIEINMFFDEENHIFKLKFLGEETIKTKFGNVRCRKYIPYVQSGRVFKSKESVTVWLSDDQNRIPIRFQADLKIGSIKCDLEKFKNLKHPFKIQYKG